MKYVLFLSGMLFILLLSSSDCLAFRCGNEVVSRGMQPAVLRQNVEILFDMVQELKRLKEQCNMLQKNFIIAEKMTFFIQSLFIMEKLSESILLNEEPEKDSVNNIKALISNILHYY